VCRNYRSVRPALCLQESSLRAFCSCLLVAYAFHACCEAWFNKSTTRLAAARDKQRKGAKSSEASQNTTRGEKSTFAIFTRFFVLSCHCSTPKIAPRCRTESWRARGGGNAQVAAAPLVCFASLVWFAAHHQRLSGVESARQDWRRSRLRGWVSLTMAAVSRSAATAIDADAAVEFEPFPMADLPSAYWVGRQRGAVSHATTACHMLFAFHDSSYDVPKLEHALNVVIRRHKMLRCVITPDGFNQVLRTVPSYQIRVEDKSQLSSSEFKQWLDEQWDTMLRRVFDSETWPLFEARVVISSDGSWLLTDFDHMTVDLRSVFIVFDEWSEAYAGRSDALPRVPTLTYRQAVQRMSELRKSARFARDQEYWLNRIDALPSAPPLPYQTAPSKIGQSTFRRIEQ